MAWTMTPEPALSFPVEHVSLTPPSPSGHPVFSLTRFGDRAARRYGYSAHSPHAPGAGEFRHAPRQSSRVPSRRKRLEPGGATTLRWAGGL